MRRPRSGCRRAAGRPISLDDALAVTQGPASCPACGATEVQDAPSALGRWDAQDEVHPLVWGEGYGIADTYVCPTCDAGWIEGWRPHPITWVRPWRAG